MRWRRVEFLERLKERKRVFLKQAAKKRRRSTKKVRKDYEEKAGDAREKKVLL